MDRRLLCIQIVLLFLLLAAVSGCRQALPPIAVATPPGDHAQQKTADPIGALLPAQPSAPPSSSLEKMGFTTQVGAFTNLDNAVRLEQNLEAHGIDAYYFRHESGLYKVRFGNHPDYSSARREAEALQRQGLIDNYFIVIPQDYAAARIARDGKGDLRAELVHTARRFLGVPYRWGGENRNGFDCSGLTMVCYRLNGLNLPRNSRSQFRAGHTVTKSELKKGDLVFFATHGGTRVTHVGMYIGHGKFIHAPRTGKTVRVASLSSSYFKRTFVGARSYL